MKRNQYLPAVLVILFGLLFFSWSGGLLAQEHPAEHPTKAAPKAKAKAGVTKEMMAQAIKDYVEKDAQMKGGYFLVYDTKSKKPLTLTLTKVHQDKLSKVGDSLYFACCDFKTAEGKAYDLDFFMKGADSNLSVSEVMIHKEEDKPRYSWYEENGIWKRK